MLFRSLIALLLLSWSVSLLAETHRCKDHSSVLTIEFVGASRTNQWAWFNGHKLIFELANDLWFIENVTCTKDGFLISASKITAGIRKIQKFELIIGEDGLYEIL